ncbi:uncharacterized protein LOC122392822 [Amphibalanus amphitrite]|uniref:uncharacterized protein LOC122392822 n=1 Tax=Amphibalanus amphitrite TaxID=1232801 RepID=UPI001C905842|nr:uncharacterized protein LOC122392822 [Amphibalanus amphitrite]
MTARVSVGRVLKDTGRQYWGRTGVGGLSNAYSADWRPQRLIWLVLFAIGLVMTVMDVVDVIEDYYAFPHSTQMEVVYDRSANFPAVTVCSQSKIDCRRLLSTSLGEPDNGHISKLLKSFRCLDPSGLQCPYIWTIVAGTVTRSWLADKSVSCLECEQCETLQELLEMLRRKGGGSEMAEDLDWVFGFIGCNTTCPQPKTFTGGVLRSTGDTDGTAASAGTTDDGTAGSTDTANDGTAGSTDTASDGTAESKDTASDGTAGSTDTANDGTAGSTDTASDGTAGSKDTANDGTAGSTDTASDGTAGSTDTASDGTAGSTDTVSDGTVGSTDTAAGSTDNTESGTVKSADTADGGAAGSTDNTDVVAQKLRRKRAVIEAELQDSNDPRSRVRKLDPGNFKASKAYDEDMHRLNEFMMLSEAKRIRIGIAWEDFIKDCTYLGTSCKDELLFRTTSSAEYGNCFTFNSNVTETSDPLAGQRVTGLTGQQYSLDLLLDLNHHTFPPVTATKGARVQVHQPDQQPDVEDSGLSVMPNVATSIAIEQLTIQRLPYPYKSQCITEWTDAEYVPVPPTDEDVKESYSTTRCQKMCLQSLFIERCDCQHAKYPSPLTFRKHGKPLLERIRPCLLTVKGNDTECTNSIQQKFDNGDVTCHCPSACFERSFNTFQSMAEWPRDVYLIEAASQMGIDIRGLTPDSRKELASNILEIKVFFKTLNTAALTQSEFYTYSSFFSSLGGAMSLYLGISIIMVAEILEFLCLLVWNLIRLARGSYASPDVLGTGDRAKVGDVKKVAIRPDGVEITYIGDTRIPMTKPIYSAAT